MYEHEPRFVLRILVISMCVVLTNIFFSWKTKCFADGIKGCINPDYIGHNYLWSALGFVIAMFILFIYDCWGYVPEED